MSRNNHKRQGPKTLRERTVMAQELVQTPLNWLERGHPGTEADRMLDILSEPVNLQYARMLMRGTLELAERILTEDGPAMNEQMRAVLLRQIAVITDSTQQHLGEDDDERHHIEWFLLQLTMIIDPDTVAQAAGRG